MIIDNDFHDTVQQNALKCGELDVNVKDIYQKLKSQQSSIDGISGEIDDIDEDITDINGDITSIGNSISTINGNISTISGNLSTLSGTVSTLSGTVSTNTGAISTINGTLTTHGNSISTINGNITTINGSISSINSQISNLEKVTIAYDKNSNDAQINRGYTSGLLSYSNLSIDLNDYEYVRIYLNVYNYASSNVGVTSKIVLLDIGNPVNNICYVNDKVEYLVDGYLQTTSFTFYASYDISAKIFTPVFFYDVYPQSSGYYYVYKIEGVKK